MQAETAEQIEDIIHKSIRKYESDVVISVAKSVDINEVYSNFMVAYQGFYSNLISIECRQQMMMGSRRKTVQFNFKYRIGRVKLTMMETEVNKKVEELGRTLFCSGMPDEIPAFKKLLEKLTLNKKDSVKQLAIVLNRIAEKKQHEDIAIEEPLHSLWNNEEEFDAAVMERLERLVRSDLKMARRGALKKAEMYLYAVHDTHDYKMAQVYERIVYELKITSDGLYNQIRNCIREE